MQKRGVQEKVRTVLLLSPACCAVRAVWPVRNVRIEETFLSFTDPPVLQTIQEHLGGAHPTDTLAWGVEARLWARWHTVDIHEQV
jgi:hypothetical protein